MAQEKVFHPRDVILCVICFCFLPLLALRSHAQVRLSPDQLTPQQGYLLDSYGLSDRSGLHLLLSNDSQKPLTVIVVTEGKGIDIDPSQSTVILTSGSPQVHLGVSQIELPGNPYPSSAYMLHAYAYDDKTFQSELIPIGEYRYPDIEWTVVVRTIEQIALGSTKVVGRLTISPKFDPNPPSPEEESLIEGPPSPIPEPFDLRFLLIVTAAGQH